MLFVGNSLGIGSGWFVNNMSVKIGNGKNIMFKWFGSCPVRELYHTLYHLSLRRGGCVADMGSQGHMKLTFLCVIFRATRGCFSAELQSLLARIAPSVLIMD